MTDRKEKLNYRNNVGAVIVNDQSLVLCGERLKYPNQWQFPQGGIDSNESTIDAMYREVNEETGLKKENLRQISQTKDWLYYQTPKAIKRGGVIYHGQRQVWFLLQLIKAIDLSSLKEVKSHEFSRFKWMVFEDVFHQLVEFRKPIYQEVYRQFKVYLN